MESLSIFVGTGKCNANCNHCAGRPLRKYGSPDFNLIEKTIKDCHEKGARYLSISGSGEPTLSPFAVSKVLKIISINRLNFSPINLYTNGIKLADPNFVNYFLKQWRLYDLTTFYITVHSINENENAKIYGIKKYPSLKTIVENVKKSGFLLRANIMLSKNTINTFDEFKRTTEYLRNLGFNKVSSWPIRTLDDKLDQDRMPDPKELEKMKDWADNAKSNITVLTEKSKIKYKNMEKLTLFPNGVLSNTWCS